jgi:Bax protein
MKFWIVKAFFLVSLLGSTTFPKVYYSFKNPITMKAYFFNHMALMVIKENNKILQDRKFIKSFFFLKDQPRYKNSDKLKRFKQIEKKYNLTSKDKYDKFLRRIDIVPVSLVITQAAIESAWGKSRFFKEANNIFGHWTWTGKGLVPKDRKAGLKHKIKIYDSLEDSIRGYLLNLNVGHSYKKFRAKRERLRKEGKILSGIALAPTLTNYSELKDEYTKLLVRMIKQNKLENYDR